jgi:hypothetical protein
MFPLLDIFFSADSTIFATYRQEVLGSVHLAAAKSSGKGISYFHFLSLYRSSFPTISVLCKYIALHYKNRLAIFPSPAGISLNKLSLSGNNLIIPGQGEFGY